MHVCVSTINPIYVFSRTNNYDVMFHFATFISQTISSSVRIRGGGNPTRVLSLVGLGCQSKPRVRHFRCQVALSLWKDALSEERRLFIPDRSLRYQRLSEPATNPAWPPPRPREPPQLHRSVYPRHVHHIRRRGRLYPAVSARGKRGGRCVAT